MHPAQSIKGRGPSYSVVNQQFNIKKPKTKKQKHSIILNAAEDIHTHYTLFIRLFSDSVCLFVCHNATGSEA